MSTSYDLSSGHVFIKRTRIDRLKRVFSFEIDKDPSALNETFNSQFKEVPFAESEKKNLTQRHRFELKFFKTIEEEEISGAVDQFIQDLSGKFGKTLIIEASSTGAFLCLAAIFSGRLPKNQDWIFELSDIPVAVFPTSLIKETSPLDDYEVNFYFHPKSWMNGFPTLRKAPTELKREFNWQDPWDTPNHAPKAA